MNLWHVTLFFKGGACIKLPPGHLDKGHSTLTEPQTPKERGGGGGGKEWVPIFSNQFLTTIISHFTLLQNSGTFSWKKNVVVLSI